jgi:clorobiocin biosynthesis protein CloN6
MLFRSSVQWSPFLILARVFHKSLEEHRQAVIAPLWYQRLNYEPKWLLRRELQDVAYEAMTRLVTIKGELGLLPSSICQSILATINEIKLILS